MTVFNARRRFALWAILFALGTAAAPAQTVFDFEDADPLSSPLVGGDVHFWRVADDFGADGTGHSLVAFDPLVKPSPADALYPQDPFESFTYDVPIALTSGTVTLDFYDTLGLAGMGAFEWTMSAILEDANNPQDFVAVEITRLPYGGGRYYPTEGIDDGADSVFDTYAAGPQRSVGWHTITFSIDAVRSRVKVDSGPFAAEAQGPGGSSTLRLRFMADSPTGGGFANWTQTGATSYPAAPGLVFFDNLVFTAQQPSAATATFGFESGDVDSAGSFMGPSAHDNPNMNGFVNDFATTTALASEGATSGCFANGVEPFKGIVFDLSGASAGSATLQFHDARGAATPSGFGVDAFGGSVLIENGSNPADFIALEIWDAPYPGDSSAPNNYYCVRSNPGGGPATFNSDYFGDRSVGWQHVEIALTATESYIVLNGQENLDGGGRMTGPGLNANPRLRIVNGSASNGGFGNWTNAGELDAAYVTPREPYVRFDKISLPIAMAGVADWDLYK